jgi:hypothetical protein
MKKLLLLLFLPLVSNAQENIERYKIYPTDNIYTSLKLDTATGKIWQVQIGIGDSSNAMTSILSNFPIAEFEAEIIERHNIKTKLWELDYKNDPDASPEDIEYFKPAPLKDFISNSRIAQNGRFKLYPTDNIYNFIMLDVINGDTYQVQWSSEEDERIVMPIVE